MKYKDIYKIHSKMLKTLIYPLLKRQTKKPRESHCCPIQQLLKIKEICRIQYCIKILNIKKEAGCACTLKIGKYVEIDCFLKV